eukprot:COSAG01_NODE_3087_length_6609_cov_2.598925_4_plen_214_part_00
MKKVPFTTRRKIRLYYQHFFKNKSVFNETEILRNLPPNMSSELIYCMYKNIIENCPLFRNLTDDVIGRICLELCPYAAPAGEIVIQEGTPGTDLYLVVLGNVLVTANNVGVCVLNEGSFFGEMGLLADVERIEAGRGVDLESAASMRSKTVTAVTNCELVFLPQREARKLVQELPAFKSRLLQFRASRASRDALKTLASGQVWLPFIFAGHLD